MQAERNVLALSRLYPNLLDDTVEAYRGELHSIFVAYHIAIAERDKLAREFHCPENK